MERAVPRVLVAARGVATRELRAVLEDSVEVIEAGTLEEAVSRYQQEDPDLVVLGYHFDELRPYRFVRHVREDRRRPGRPIVLVQVLPLHFGRTEEAQIGEAYHALGVDEFLDLSAEAERAGPTAARARLRHAVLKRLPAARRSADGASSESRPWPTPTDRSAPPGGRSRAKH